MLEPDQLPDQLAAMLRTRRADGSPVTVTDFERITGGYSRYMARFTAEAAGERQRFVLRADPPPGQSILDTDRRQEWEVVTALHAHDAVTMPVPRHFDDGEQLGAPAIVFDEVPGDTLYTRVQQGDAADHAELLEPLADLTASIHGTAPDAVPAAVERPASWEAYMRAGAARWADVERAHAERDPFMRVISAWLAANTPPPTALGLVHGDLQAPNMLVHESTGELYLLDWEMAHIGDPREDLGWWKLAHRSQPPDLIAVDEARFLARYRERTGSSEAVVNPATVAYFTVFAALGVFANVIGATASMARGQASGMSVAYMTNAIPFMHGVFVDAMRTAGAWREERS